MIGVTLTPLYVPLINWIVIGQLFTTWGLYIDNLTLLMFILVTGVSCLVYLYSLLYIAEDPHLIRFSCDIALFTLGGCAVKYRHNIAIQFWHSEEAQPSKEAACADCHCEIKMSQKFHFSWNSQYKCNLQSLTQILHVTFREANAWSSDDLICSWQMVKNWRRPRHRCVGLLEAWNQSTRVARLGWKVPDPLRTANRI